MPQTPSWWGTFAKQFASNLFSASFYKQELASGGCLNAAEQGAHKADVLGKILPPGSTAVEDTIKATAASMAYSYAATRGLVNPLGSKVVEGILTTGDFAAAAFTAGYFDLQAGWGVLGNELPAAIKGTCR